MRYRIKWNNVILYTMILIGIIYGAIWTMQKTNEVCVIKMTNSLEKGQVGEFVVRVSNMNGESKRFESEKKRDIKNIKKKNSIILLPEAAADVFKIKNDTVVVLNYINVGERRWIAINKKEKEQGVMVLNDGKNISLVPLVLMDSENGIVVKPVKSKKNTIHMIEKETLCLVNADTPFSTIKLNLFDMKRVGLPTNYSELFIQREILPSLIKLVEDAKKAGFQFSFVSGYRNIDKQRKILNDHVNHLKKNGVKDPEKIASKTVQNPGYSEHHTGYAVDVLASDYTTQNFYKSNEAKWLLLNSSKYGFILRYPKGKETVTHISYEPWHFRYVGEPYARFMTQNELTLEELIEKAKNMEIVIEGENEVTVLVVMNKNEKPKLLNYSIQPANCKLFNISKEWVAYELKMALKNREKIVN